MPAKKKTTTKSSSKTTSARISRAKKPEKSLKEVSSGSFLKRTGRAKWVLLTLVLVALILFLGNKYLVVAWVNNKPITRLELNNALNKRYGKDLLEELIVEKLIEDEARKRSIQISQEEIDSEIKKVEEQQGGADKLSQILQAQNISRDDFNKLVRLQLMRQKMFGEGKDSTDEEVAKYIEENKANLDLETRTASEQAKLKENIKDQLKNQKVNQEFNAWLNGALTGPQVSRQL